MSEPSPVVQRCAQRRATLAQAMTARGGGVAILMTAPEVARNRDTEYPFRWDSYFYYLSAFPEPQAALVIRTTDSGFETLLFCREKNLEREIWDGFRFGPDQARITFGVDACYPIGELAQRMPGLLANAANVFAPLASNPSIDEHLRGWLQAVRAQARSGVSAPKTVVDATALIDEMRLRKDALELDVMERAARISANAHCRAMKATRPGMFEYEIEAELLHEFRKQGSQFPAYGSIVAGGTNACVLHYRENNQKLSDGSLLLIDAGCELDGYASDITRTFPVNGRFSKAQQALYEIVLAAQQAAVDMTRPGSHFMQPHEAAVGVLTQGLVDLGLIAGPVDDAIAQERYKRFYMHRTGHWLGMDVHDCGDYHDPDSPTPTRAWRVLEPGMVMTIEPGLYVQAAADVDERYHGIGIRIEDDAVVTADGCRLITRDVPVAVRDIEALMKH